MQQELYRLKLQLKAAKSMSELTPYGATENLLCQVLRTQVAIGEFLLKSTIHNKTENSA